MTAGVDDVIMNGVVDGGAVTVVPGTEKQLLLLHQYFFFFEVNNFVILGLIKISQYQ